MESETERILRLELTVQNVMQQLMETRAALEQLAAVSGLEYSLDAKCWVGRDKLIELRSNPR
jgi:hypothetical protein